MIKEHVLTVTAEPKTFKRSETESFDYIKYCIVINGISVRVKPADSTASAVLEAFLVNNTTKK